MKKEEEPKQEYPKSTGDIISDYAIGQSKTIQKCMHLDAEMAYKSLPKQETLEEIGEKLYIIHENNDLLYGHSEELQLAYKAGVVDGAEWKAKRMYSEEEVGEILYNAFGEYGKHYGIMLDGALINKLFEQFKKK